MAADAKRGPPALNMQAPSMVFRGWMSATGYSTSADWCRKSASMLHYLVQYGCHTMQHASRIERREE